MIINFISDIFEILLCLYAVIQHIFIKSDLIHKFIQYQGVKIILGLLSTLLAILSLTLLTLLLMPLAIFKYAVSIMLRIKHKRNYGGMLKEIDALWALETANSRHTITTILFVNFNIPESEIMQFTKKLFSEIQTYQFTSLRRRAMGYFYRLKNQIEIGDLIKELKLSDEETTNKDLFEIALGKICSSPMPINDTACFEVLVSTKSIKFSCTEDGDQEHIYPLIVRIHHCVGDGIALLKFLLRNIADEQTFIKTESDKRDKCTKKIDAISSGMNCVFGNEIFECVANFYNTLKKMINVSIYYFPPIESADQNALHGPELIGEKIFASYIEDNPVYIEKIKLIKKRFPGSTFTDVVMTAVSASFWKYFKQNCAIIPDKLNLSLISRPIEKNLQYIVTETGPKECHLGNEFSIGTLNLPININVKNDQTVLRKRFELVKEESNKLKDSVDTLLNYWQLRFFPDLLPGPILNLLVGINHNSTVTFSNLPGIRGIHIKGQKVKDIVFWVATVRDMGLGLSILTYDDRFQMGLIADKVLIDSHQNAQYILHNIIKYIDKMDAELINGC